MSSDSQQQEQQPGQPDLQQNSPDLKKAAAKENLVFLTSGAKEKLDKTIAGMKGASQMMKHPFDKPAREEANQKTIEEKNAVGEKQEKIRQTAHIQHAQEKAVADGVDLGAQQPVYNAGGDGNQNVEDLREPENHASEGSPVVPGGNESAPGQESVEEDSSDGSSRRKAGIPPGSAEYQSG